MPLNSLMAPIWNKNINFLLFINPPAPCAGIAIQSLFFLNNKHIHVDTHASIIEDRMARWASIIEDRMASWTSIIEDRMAKGHILGFNVFVTNRSQKIDLAAILGGN